MIFQATSKSIIVCARLALAKIWIDGFTGQRRKIASKMNLFFRFSENFLGANGYYGSHFLAIFQAACKFVTVSARLVLEKCGD